MTDQPKDYSYTGYQATHLMAARALRKEMTPAEKKLWYDYCKKSPYKFYRQRSIDRFIVDFYSSQAGIVIELDGAPHFTEEGEQYDTIRTEILERYCLEVIRFTNNQVMNYFPQVCRKIDEAIQRRVTKSLP